MRVGTLISGLILVLAGVVLFLINIGYGSWTDIHELSKWWPILLIIVGIGILGRGKIPRLAAYLIVILSVAAVCTYMIQMDKTQDHQDHNETITRTALSISQQQYPQAKRCHLDVDYGGGELFIIPGTENLLKGDFDNKPVIKNITSSLQDLEVNLSQKGYSWSSMRDNAARWQLMLSPHLTWILDIDAGAVNGSIDLTGIPLQELNCDVGAGSMAFILGNNGANSKINIDAGASDIKLRIPDDTGIRIELDGALSSNNLDELGWVRTDNAYISPNYQKAQSKIDCFIELSVGNLDVKVERDA